VFAEEAARYDRSLVSSALADGVKCAEVSSHYKYRKSVLCLPADMGRRHQGSTRSFAIAGMLTLAMPLRQLPRARRCRRTPAYPR
jgi:hypothetical protein